MIRSDGLASYGVIIDGGLVVHSEHHRGKHAATICSEACCLQSAKSCVSGSRGCYGANLLSIGTPLPGPSKRRPAT